MYLFSSYVEQAFDGTPAAINLGPVTLSVEQIKRGIGSILIVFLPHTLIIFMFKFAGSKTKHEYKQTTTNEEGKIKISR